MTYRREFKHSVFDETFYYDRDAVDHWNIPGYHHDRLIPVVGEAVATIKEHNIQVIGDFGAGTGGALNEIRNQVPDRTYYGYDLCPKAIIYAHEHYNLDIKLCEVTQEFEIFYPDYKNLLATELVWPELLIMSETLEHLCHPHTFIHRLRHTPVQHVVISVPAGEGPNGVDPIHQWAWTEESFPNIFREAGFDVKKHYVAHGTQYVVAQMKK